MGSSSSEATSNREAMIAFGAANSYPPNWMKEAEKTTGDELLQRGVKLPWWSRVHRWWHGWK